MEQMSLWQQLEVLTMRGAKDRKIAVIKRADTGNAQAFRQRHQTAVHEIEISIEMCNTNSVIIASSCPHRLS
jgi:hypothetical protein